MSPCGFLLKVKKARDTPSFVFALISFKITTSESDEVMEVPKRRAVT